jgi:chemotaxis protein CheD
VNIVVNVSDVKASADPQATLATYSLGSCIGVAVYDPLAQVAGMLHYQLPTSSLDPDRARQNPAMFADSGTELLLKTVGALGADKRRLKVKLAGAAQMFDDHGLFNIGRRNHAAIRKILWQYGLLIEKEDVGGETPRTMYLRVADGNLTIKSGSTSKEL